GAAPTNKHLWGPRVAREQHARNPGKHRKQQPEGPNAAHGATGDQPEPKAKPKNSADENCVGECQPAKRQQQPSKLEPRQIIDREAKLVAVLTDLSLAGGASLPDPSIIDEDVEAITFLANCIRQALHFA